MTENSTLQPGDKVVALSSLTRSVGIASAVAAAICYQFVYGVPDVFTLLVVLVPALVIGAVAGWIMSMRFNKGKSGGTTTIVKHGKDGLSATIRASFAVAAVIAIIFILIVRFVFGFDGNWIALIATMTLPAFLVATVWAMIVSLS
jgi:hypothetical protein